MLYSRGGGRGAVGLITRCLQVYGPIMGGEVKIRNLW